MRRLRLPRRGASAVEFALTLPIVMLIISAVLDYGWFLAQDANVLHAVREGARVGVAVPLDDGPDTAAINHTTQILEVMGIGCGSGCEVTATIGTTATLDVMTVRAVIPYDPLLGIVPVPVELRSELTMALEEQSD